MNPETYNLIAQFMRIHRIRPRARYGSPPFFCLTYNFRRTRHCPRARFHERTCETMTMPVLIYAAEMPSFVEALEYAGYNARAATSGLTYWQWLELMFGPDCLMTPAQYALLRAEYKLFMRGGHLVAKLMGPRMLGHLLDAINGAPFTAGYVGYDEQEYWLSRRRASVNLPA